MPEMPEVETTRRSIDAPLRGARVAALRLGKPLRHPLGIDPPALAGLRVEGVLRRGKYLWIDLGDGAGGPAGGLLLHLGMSGSLALLRGEVPARGPHDHADLETSHGTLRLTDPRRFGAVVWAPSLAQPPASTLLSRLGAEPFDAALTPERLHAALRRRRAPIKQVLLAGDVVVGAGNIYACEALFDAGIHPALRADRLSLPRAGRLLASLRSTLARALALGGSTLRNYRDASGAAGAFQAQTAVYGREGEPCPRCGTPVRRRVMGQRSTFFCPACQRR